MPVALARADQALFVLACRCRPSVLCHAEKQEPIRGFTPANYISYSDSSEHTCHHMIGITVEAPVSVCFDLWDDWCRLLDFLDLVSQVGDSADARAGAVECFGRVAGPSRGLAPQLRNNLAGLFLARRLA